MGRIKNLKEAKTYKKQKEIFQKMFPGMRLGLLRSLDNSDKERSLRDKLLEDFKLKRWYDAQIEAGNLGVLHGDTFGAGQEAHDVAKLTDTEQQSQLRKKYAEEAQKELGPLLERLRTPYTHPVNKRMEEIFGHLQNPIMQGLFAQEQPRGSLFPSAIEQEYLQGAPMSYQQQQQSGAFGDLFSALGNHAMNQYVDPWMKKQTPESLEALYNQGMQEYAQPAYNYAMGSRPVEALKYLGGLPSQANTGLENYIQGGLQMKKPETWGQTFQQSMSAPLYAARHPLEALSELGGFASNAYNALRGRPINKQ